MRCRDVEHLILGFSVSEPAAGVRKAVEEHGKQCPKCAGFLCDWQELQGNLKEMSGRPVPAELDAKVRTRCREEAVFLLGRQIGAGLRIAPKIPRFVYAALAGLAFLTIFLLAPGAEALFRTYKITSETAPAFVLILQNVLMLLVSPVILGRLNGRKSGERQVETVNV